MQKDREIKAIQEIMDILDKYEITLEESTSLFATLFVSHITNMEYEKDEIIKISYLFLHDLIHGFTTGISIQIDPEKHIDIINRVKRNNPKHADEIDDLIVTAMKRFKKDVE